MEFYNGIYANLKWLKDVAKSTSLFFPHHNFIVGEVGGGGSKVAYYIMWGVVKAPPSILVVILF